MNLGWECPKCHAIYAPTVTECSRCAPVPFQPWPIVGGPLRTETVTYITPCDECQRSTSGRCSQHPIFVYETGARWAPGTVGVQSVTETGPC